MSDEHEDPPASQVASNLENVVNDAPDDNDDEQETSPDARASDSTAADAAELDGLRIRQLASLRRSEYRSRSHAIIAMLVCAVAAAQLALTTWLRVRAIGWTSVPLLCAALIPLAVWGTVHFYRRAIELHREATRPMQDVPQEAPDFSTLGDGSEQIDRLDEIR
jgi:hypothetical protein